MKMNKFLGMTWEELEHEIFTPEEIKASEHRVAPIIAEIKNSPSRTKNFFNREAAQVAI